MIQGIDVSRLPKGTKLLVKTHYSLYVMDKLDFGNSFKVKGGKYFKEAAEARFAGSTWGGSAIRLNWINYGLHMEFQMKSGKVITTSGVVNATIITPTYQYTMNWEDGDEMDSPFDPEDI